MKKPKIILVCVGDLHVNDTTGLCPPEFRRANRDVHLPSVGQRFLWQAWLDFWDYVAKRKKKTGATVIASWGGDIGDMNKHSKAELISTVEANVQAAMAEVAEPGLKVADKNFVIRGTTAHSGQLAQLEEAFAKDIGAEPCEYTGMHAWPVLPLDMEGTMFELAHQPPTSTAIAGKREQACSRAVERMVGLNVKQRVWPADIYVWHHVHYMARGESLGSRGFYVPPFKLVGAYGYEKCGVGTVIEPVGGLIFELRNGEWEEKFLRFIPRRMKAWQMKSES